MENIQISDEELEMMNYNDVAYIILENKGQKMQIADLFKIVCSLLNLDEEEFQNHIGDFFELLSTDKRFIMLEGGYWDLKIKHNKGIIKFDDDEEDDVQSDDSLSEESDNTENGDSNFDEENEDDDVIDDDLSDLIIIDDNDEENL